MDFLHDVMFWREAMTVFAFGLFLSITAWAYSPLRKQEFEEVAIDMVEDNDDPGFQSGRREGGAS